MFRRLFNPKLALPLLSLAIPSYAMLNYRTISAPNQLTVEDIQKQILICYQKTGIQETDDIVFAMLEQFVEKYRTLISEDFEIIMIEQETQSEGVEPELTIFRADDFGVVPLKKYIKTKGYSKLFKKLNKEINQAEEVGLENIMEVIEAGSQRDTQQLFIFPEQFTKEAIKKTKKHLQGFLQENQYAGREVKAYIIKDQMSKTILKLNNLDSKFQPNKVYLLAPKNRNLLNKATHKYHKIFGKLYAILEGEASTNAQTDCSQKTIVEQFVFPPFLRKSHPNTLILRATVNLNQDSEKTLTAVYRQLGKLTDISKMLSFKHDEKLEASSCKIYVDRNNFDQIVSIYEPNCKYSKQEKLSLLGQTHTWRYTGELRADLIKQWISAISQGKVEQYYKSEPVEEKRFQSKRIVGEDYLSTISKEEETMVFHFSKSCFSCKKFAGFYEEVAKQALSWDKPVQFYRIDNDENKAQGMRNFNATPVFALYRKYNGIPIPFIYRNAFFTKTLFMDFIVITRLLKLMESQQLQAAVERVTSSKQLLSDCLPIA